MFSLVCQAVYLALYNSSGANGLFFCANYIRALYPQEISIENHLSAAVFRLPKKEPDRPLSRSLLRYAETVLQRYIDALILEGKIQLPCYDSHHPPLVVWKIVDKGGFAELYTIHVDSENAVNFLNRQQKSLTASEKPL